MAKIFMHHQKMMANEPIQLVIGDQEIRTILVTEEERTANPFGRKPINSLVTSVHYATVLKKNGFEKRLFYRDQFNHAIAVMNDSIINLFESGINFYVTDCGVILLWDKHDIYSTVNMQTLNFHPELDELFRSYYIKRIYSRNDREFMSLVSLKNGKIEDIRFHTEINLQSDCSVKILLPKRFM